MNRAERRKLAKSKNKFSFEKFMDVYKVMKDYEVIPEGAKVKIDRKKLEERQQLLLISNDGLMKIQIKHLQ